MLLKYNQIFRQFDLKLDFLFADLPEQHQGQTVWQ